MRRHHESELAASRRGGETVEGRSQTTFLAETRANTHAMDDYVEETRISVESGRIYELRYKDTNTRQVR